MQLPSTRQPVRSKSFCAALPEPSVGNTRCGAPSMILLPRDSPHPPDVSPSAPSGIVVFKTLATPPSPPHPPALLSRRRTSLTLCWASPTDVGGDPVKEYILACRPPIHETISSRHVIENVESCEWEEIHTGPDTELTIPGLRAAQKYEFKLKVRVHPWQAGFCLTVIQPHSCYGAAVRKV